MMERLRFKCEACGFENLSFGEEQLETLRSEFPAGSPQQLFASVASDYRNFWVSSSRPTTRDTSPSHVASTLLSDLGRSFR